MPDGPVAVVGGGPGGLAAAIALRRRGLREVVVIEREAEPGGIPRHAHHQGFGLRDLRRVLSGPAYARRYAELARAAGVELLTETMVTGWDEAGCAGAHRPRRAHHPVAGGGRAGHRLPRAAALGAPRPGQPARRRHDHGDAAAARLPARAPGGPARAGGRR